MATKSAIEVLFKDKHYLVINKPPAFASQGALRTTERIGEEERTASLVRTLEQEHGSLRIVHRLDSSVTGALVLARSKEAAAQINSQFFKRRVRKVYLGIVMGEPKEIESVMPAVLFDGSDGQVVHRRLGEIIDPHRGELVDVMEGQRNASLKWAVVDRKGDFSLLRLEPRDGHRHLIRVLCAKVLGQGILGDYKYAHSRRHDRYGFKDSGQICLHALDIGFNVFAVKQQFRAPPHPRFVETAATLGLNLDKALRGARPTGIWEKSPPLPVGVPTPASQERNSVATKVSLAARTSTRRSSTSRSSSSTSSQPSTRPVSATTARRPSRAPATQPPSVTTWSLSQETKRPTSRS